jgi:ferredoxin-type protein NapH
LNKIETKKKYLIARRIVQISLLVLFLGGNYWGWTVLKGNLSAATLFDTISLADPFAVMQILAAGFISASDVLVGAITIFALYAIIGNRTFCGWVCPMNMVTDLARWFGNKFGLLEKTKIRLNRNYRYWFLVLSLVLSFVLGYAAFEMISPIGILHRSIIFGIGSGWVIVVAIFLLDMGVVKNAWCGHLCPLGAFYSVTGRYGLLKIKHDAEKCTKCNDCFPLCPEVQVLAIVGKSSGYIKSGECTNCGRCIEACKDDALRFSMNYVKK